MHFAHRMLTHYACLIKLFIAILIKKYHLKTIVFCYHNCSDLLLRKICSSVILNFSRVLRPRKVSQEKVLQIRGRIYIVFEIHFSWPQYPVKFQNYTRTNYSNSERSGQLR